MERDIPRLGASVIELIIVEKEMRDFAGGAGEKKRKVNSLGICSSFLWNVWNEIPIGLYR